MRWRRRKPARAPSFTLNDGRPTVLETPFDRLAICDGAIYLSSSRSNARLSVPADAGAHLTQIKTHAIDPRVDET